MYDVVLNDDGIWEYAEWSYFTEEIQNMWGLVTDILICNCYLGCIGEGHITPQDMELLLLILLGAMAGFGGNEYGSD